MFDYQLRRQCALAYLLNLLLWFFIKTSDSSTIVLRGYSKSPVLVHQFPNGSWVENIATLKSGKLLVTLLNSAELVLLDLTSPNKPTVVYQSTKYTALLGIAQPKEGCLTVVHGNISSPDQVSSPGSFGILLFTLHNDGHVSLQKEIAVPGASMLDGLTAVPGSSRYVLSADSKLGVVWRIDLVAGISQKAFTSSLLQPRPNTTVAAVNGVHAQNGYLYFTNSNQATFGRIPMTADGFQASSSPGHVLITNSQGAPYDDFALGPTGSGVFYLCSPTTYAINKFDVQTGQQTIFAGGPAYAKSFSLPIAAMLSRDQNTLYVTTAGTIPGIGGSVGGQVFAIRVST